MRAARSSGRILAVPATVLALLALGLPAACTSSPDARSGPPAAPSGSPTGPESTGPESTGPESTGSPAGSPTGSSTGSPPPSAPAPKPDPVSLPALFDRGYNGGRLRLGRVIVRTDAYTSHYVTYRSGRLRISGILDVPHGRGPHPALVLAHGYIDPSYYANGQGLRREQDWLARAGYVVLHTDYRNHAGSSDDPTAERRMRLGYTVDVIDAVRALRRTEAVRVDDDRIGLLGRSMGGGVVYNAISVRPGLVDAAVVFAPVSSRAIDNFNRWIRNDTDPTDRSTSAFILRHHGEPEDNPRWWREVSPRTYFDRVRAPVLIHHGTGDDTCPIRWSRATTRAMRRAGVDVRMRTYPGEPHAFIADWPLSMRRSVAFFRAHL